MEEKSSTAEPKKKLRFRWYQFKLRTLLVFVMLAGCGSAWLSFKVHEGIRQHAGVVAIRTLSGVVHYDYEFSAIGIVPDATPPAPTWLRTLLGDDCFANVCEVKLWVAPDRSLAIGLEYLTAFKRLKRLSLEGYGAANDGLKHLRALTQIEELSLPFNTTDAGLENLKGLSNLKELSLQSTQVTGAGLAYLNELTKLTALHLEWTQLTDVGLEHLKGLTHLKRLWLDGASMTDAKLENLRGLTQLEELSINDCEGAAAGVAKLQEELPNCEISWHRY